MSFLRDKRIVVTGGRGFLGSHLIPLLKKSEPDSIVTPSSREFDLVEASNIARLYETFRPQVVIHLAARVGGIGANRSNPGKFFYENAMMGLQLMEFGRRYELEKFVALGTICAYPKFTPVPFKEENLWNGYPEETNAPYGLAKKMMLVQAQSYRQQYGFNAIYLLPVNLYGPRDNFDLETSHVIPALIRKCVEAVRRNQRRVDLWGSGQPTREFLYVEDAAEAIALAAEHYNGSEPVNIGSGMEIRIRELVELVAKLTGFTGEFVWDLSRPDGQPRRSLDTTRAQELFGFRAKVPFEEGLRRTIEWFKRDFVDSPDRPGQDLQPTR